MAKVRIILLMIVILMLGGCSYEYNLEYKNNNFTEEIKLKDVFTGDALPRYEDIIKTGFCADYDCKYKYDITDPLKTNDTFKTESYSVKSRLPKNLKEASVINKCFSNILYKEGKDFILIKAFGDFYCDASMYRINFTTDAKVLVSNADLVKDNTYTWTKVSKDGILLQIIKKDKMDGIVKKERRKYLGFTLFIAIILISFFALIYYLYKKGLLKRN